MKLHVRGRLFLASLAVVGAVIALAGVVAHVELRRWLEARVEHELSLRLGAVVVAVENARPEVAADALADQLGAASGARVTLIADDGIVIGDSDVAAPELARVENHAARPEIANARRDVHGRSRRTSATVHKDMLYLAARYRAADGRTGFVRVAAPYDDVDEAAARLRLLLAVAGALGIGAAVVLSAVASQLLSRTLRALVTHARALVGGERFSAAESEDEIVGLAGTLQRLGNDLGRAMGTLASERDRFAAVLEAMNEGVLGVDGDGRIVFVNAAARAMLAARPGTTSAESVGMSVLEMARVPQLDDAASRARRGEVVEDEIELELAVPSPSPSLSPSPSPPPVAIDAGNGGASGAVVRAPRVVLVRASPLRAGGAVVVLHDVTGVRKLERMRRDFVANVSHELRTPISVIRANAETLLMGGLDDTDRARAASFVDAIEKHAERLSRLVGDLLDLSRIESGQVALDKTPQPLRALALRAVESVDVRAKERKHEVNIDVPPDLEVVGDAHAFDQILVNLLDNAVKYTPPGGHITLRARESEKNVRIEVEDDGPGVAPQHRARLFERFYRVDKGRSRDAGGTGLGLAIVKHLVEAMGGTVGAAPAPTRGTIFWIEMVSAKSPERHKGSATTQE